VPVKSPMTGNKITVPKTVVMKNAAGIVEPFPG
jgi:hypothetical protein